MKHEPEPRRQQYDRAVRQVLDTLQPIPNIPALIVAYYTLSEARWQALTQAYDDDTSISWLNRGICEDAAYYRRFQEIIAASQRAV